MRTASRPVAAESEAMLRNFSTPIHSSSVSVFGLTTSARRPPLDAAR